MVAYLQDGGGWRGCSGRHFGVGDDAGGVRARHGAGEDPGADRGHRDGVRAHDRRLLRPVPALVLGDLATQGDDSLRWAASRQ